MIGGRASPASSAATRPTAPAFAVWVCRMCGRTRRICRDEPVTDDRVVDRRDLAIELRQRDDLEPSSSATNDIELSPRAS